MKKSIKRTLSLLLALTMVLSLGLPAYAVGAPAEEAVVIADEEPVELPVQEPVELPAEEPVEEPAEEPVEEPIEEPVEKPVTLPIGAGKKIGFTEEEEIVSEDLIVDIVSEESVVEEEAAPAKDFSYSESATGFSVEVSAPAGALPLGTEMVVDRLVDLSSVQNAVDRAENLNGSVQLAADISFWLNGEEIEPAEGTKLFVRMSAPEIEGIASPVVIHIPDGENAVPEVVEQMSAGDVVMADTVSFEASNFSVYAIIDGATGDMARLKVVFMNGETVVETMYLKKADVDRGQVDKAIFDPGVPVDGDKLFMGWTLDNPITFTSEVFDIDQIREKAVAALSGIEEGSDEAVLTLYAKMFKVFYLYYAYQNDDNYVTTKTEVAQVIGDSASFTVNENYVPSEPNKGMIGWVLQGSADDESAHVYKNGDTITVTEDTVLEPKVVEGCWIHFFENDGEEGGASYTPPVFVPGGENASSYRPSKKPTRPGYTFDNWYTEAEGGTVFNFDQTFVNPPAEGYTVYAHWTPNETASYKVVIWAQSVNDLKDAQNKTYDYVNFIQVDNVPTGTQITDATVAPYKNYGNSYFEVSDLAHNSKAFQYSRYEIKNGIGANKDGVSPNNDTVVNVYYDRKMFTIQFNNAAGGSSTTYYEPVDTVTANEAYGLIDGEFKKLTPGEIVKRIELYTTSPALLSPQPTTIYSANTSSNSFSSGSYSVTAINPSNIDLSNATVGTTYERINPNTLQLNNNRVSATAQSMYRKTSSGYGRIIAKVIGETGSYTYNGEPYEGQLYQKVTSNALLFTGLYGQPLSKYNYSWPSGSWNSIAYLNSFNGNLFGHSSLGTTPNKIVTQSSGTPNTTIIFYVQDANNPSSYPEAARSSYVINSNQGFNITERFVGVTPVSYKWSTSASMPGGTWDTGVDSSGFTSVERGNNTYLHIKYDLQKFDIVFRNGDTEVKRVSNIRYGQNIAGYAAEAPTIAAGDDSHYFAGWFEDPLGTNPAKWDTTMPLGNKVVYAVTAPVEYHVMVFLNGGALPEGTAQKLSFWVPYETVLDDTNFNNVTYTADDNHTLLGYYTDEACTIPWDFSTKLTGDSLTYTYSGIDDPKRETEHPDYPGLNDVGYETTVGYFMLYAGWRDDSILANGGLKVHYVDSENGYEYTDPMHYADKASVIATAAVPEANWPEGMKFEKWQLLDKGNASAVVNSYYPTEEFIADSKYADDNLVITLVPLYVEIDPELPTHIYWYANNGTGAVQKDDNVQINKGVDIPTQASWTPSGSGTTAAGEATRSAGLSYDNHVFLGWARVETGSDIDTSTLNEDDLWLVWKGDHFETDVDGVAKTVTQVACDEEQPYHDLYAVWAKVFYVYHTSTGKVDRIVMTSAVDTINLTELVNTDSFLYGGYYKAYSGASDTFKADPSEMNWVTVTAETSGYEGNKKINVYANAGLVSKAQDNGKAYTITDNIAAAEWGDAYKQRGDVVTPANDFVNGQALVYYIKEVPIENYLRPNIKYTYNTSTLDIGTIWVVSGVDAAAYEEAGFMIGSYDPDTKKFTATETLSTTDFADSLVFQATNTGATLTCTYDNQCGSYGIHTGKLYYKTVFNISSAGVPEPVNILENGKYVQQYWKTPDGAIVTGKYVRAYEGIEKSTLKPVNAEVNKGCVGVGSTITFANS